MKCKERRSVEIGDINKLKKQKKCVMECCPKWQKCFENIRKEELKILQTKEEFAEMVELSVGG